MRDDPICRAKWRVQRKFARKAGYDPVRYLDLVHENVARWATENHVRLKYADVSQLPMGPLRVKESPATCATAREPVQRKAHQHVSRERRKTT